MSTSLTSLTTNFFPSAQNGFQTTLASTISSGAATVPLNSVAGYTNGQIGVFVVDPTDSTKKQTFTGVIDTAGVQVTSVVWTAGTNQTHTGGATVVDYATATHISMLTKGITKFANQDGTLIGSVIRTALGETATTGAGWTSLGYAPNTITANGNRSYSVVYNSIDLTGTLSPGMRLRHTRTVAAPTQCTSLNGTTQYYSKATPSGISFTTTFSCSAWVKLSSYQAGGIIARRNGSTEGWSFSVNASGQLEIAALRIAGNNRFNQSAQSVPLNKWVHVAATMDASVAGSGSGAYNFYMDGVLVPSGTETLTGTVAALVQGTTALVVGCQQSAGLVFFPGKIAQAAVYSSVLSAATILAQQSYPLAGTETGEVSAYSFNNSINDLNANANNLTANGSAVATNADSPFGGQADGTISSTLDYAEIRSATFSTNTTIVVQVPKGNTIPTSGGVSAVSYSTARNPYGWPGGTKILGQALLQSSFTTSATSPTQVSGLSVPIYVPTDATEVEITAYNPQFTDTGAGGNLSMFIYDGASAGALTTQLQFGGSALGVNTATPATLTWTGKLASGNHYINAAASVAGGTQVATWYGSANAAGHITVKIVD